MQQIRPVTLFISGIVVLIVAALFYVGGENHPEQAVSILEGKLSDGRNEARMLSERSVERRDSTSRGPTPYPSQTEKVDPEKYSGFAPKPQWEKDIITLADRGDMTDVDKAVQLLSRINHLPEEGKAVAMDYATRLIPDKDYVRLRPWLFQLGTTDDLRETILLDALTRGDTVRMPTLVEMLRQPKNPGQEEIREILVAYLDEDHGNDAQKWDTAVKKWLVENPEE